jgi:hypothetical protein
LEDKFREEIDRFGEERRMSYVTSIERLAREEGRREGRQEGRREELLEMLALAMEKRFGGAGKRLMPKIKALNDVEKLRELARALYVSGNARRSEGRTQFLS